MHWLHPTWSTLTWSTLTTSTILTKYLTSSTLQLTLSLTWSTGTFILSTFGLLLIQNKKNIHTFIYIFTHIQLCKNKQLTTQLVLMVQ